MRYWMSMAMGNIVSTRLELLRQVLESLLRYRVVDIRWKKIYL